MRRKAVDQARAFMSEGQSLNSAAAEAAKPLGVSARTVMRWSDALGESLSRHVSHDNRVKTRAMPAARREYGHLRRLEVVDKLIGLIEDHIEAGIAAKELPGVAIALGTAIDKRRLEEGAATDRHDWGGEAAPSLERSRTLRLRLLDKTTG